MTESDDNVGHIVLESASGRAVVGAFEVRGLGAEGPTEEHYLFIDGKQASYLTSPLLRKRGAGYDPTTYYLAIDEEGFDQFRDVTVTELLECCARVRLRRILGEFGSVYQGVGTLFVTLSRATLTVDLYWPEEDTDTPVETRPWELARANAVLEPHLARVFPPTVSLRAIEYSGARDQTYDSFFGEFEPVPIDRDDDNEEGEETPRDHLWEFKVQDLDVPIAEIVTPLLAGLRTAARYTLEDLVSETSQGIGLHRSFHFPEPIRAAAQQYLVYFAQFLRDLGIDAEASVRERANDVLFTVAPSGGEEALKRVREALDVYLDLPNQPRIEEAAAASGDVASMQLIGIVHHLKSQVAMGHAFARLQEKTIEAQEVTILGLRAHQRLLPSPSSGNVGLPTPSGEQISKYLKVKEYEGKGFSVDLPSLFRDLKRRWSPATPSDSADED